MIRSISASDSVPSIERKPIPVECRHCRGISYMQWTPGRPS